MVRRQVACVPVVSAIPSHKAAEDKGNTCCDDAGSAEPRIIAAGWEAEFRNLDGNEDDPDAFVSEHEEEVNPVNAEVAAVSRVCAGEGQRREGCLLDDELFGNGESDTEQKEANGTGAPATNELAAEKGAAAPDHHFGDEHEEEAEAGRSAEDLAYDRGEDEKSPDGGAVALERGAEG